MDYLGDDDIEVVIQDAEDDEEFIRLYEQADPKFQRAAVRLLKDEE